MKVRSICLLCNYSCRSIDCNYFSMIFLMQSSYFFIFIIYNAFQGHFHSNFFTGCKESHFHSLSCRQTVASMNFPNRHFILLQKRLDKQDLVQIYYTKGKSTKSFDTSRVHNIQKRSLKLEAFYNNLCLMLKHGKLRILH